MRRQARWVRRGDRETLRSEAEALSSLAGVRHVLLDEARGELVATYDPSTLAPAELRDTVLRRRRVPSAAHGASFTAKWLPRALRVACVALCAS